MPALRHRRVERLERVERAELGQPGVAELAEVGQRIAGVGGQQLLVRRRPRQLLHAHLDVRMARTKRRQQLGDDLGLAPHRPEVERRRAGRRGGRSRRAVSGRAGRQLSSACRRASLRGSFGRMAPGAAHQAVLVEPAAREAGALRGRAAAARSCACRPRRARCGSCRSSPGSGPGRCRGSRSRSSRRPGSTRPSLSLTSVGGEAAVERIEEAVLRVDELAVARVHLLDGRDHDLGRERQRRERRRSARSCRRRGCALRPAPRAE